jgi:hypothetical protein
MQRVSAMASGSSPAMQAAVGKLANCGNFREWVFTRLHDGDYSQEKPRYA